MDQPLAPNARLHTPFNACKQRDSRPRTLLVGTTLSVRQLANTLQAAEPTPRLIGCLLTHAEADAGELPCPHLGGLDQLTAGDLPDADQVLLSLPASMHRVSCELAAALERAGARWRFMPTLSDQLAGRCSQSVRPAAAPTSTPTPGVVDPTQLLDRVPRALDENAIADCLTGKTVLITGAGGSIGSELAMSVARFQPRELILVERSENALFEIDREVARVFPELPRQARLADVTHEQRMSEVMDQARPAVVFHAAAHKHVPMMEDHPAEAVENNLYGTRHVAEAAHLCGAERFVMISTDKAVNPSSVMGATKRLAELFIRGLDARSDTVFSMVRFGNVLGSACSVLPIWSKQLAHGGPITVTDPAMTRYFMTIPEAAGLVLQAGALSCGGEVFLLDMGEPINILGLAERFARLQGFEPHVDIEIALTGARPGEKLFEVLAYDSEDLTPTDHASIRTWQTTQPDPAQLRQMLGAFDRLRGIPPYWQGAKPQAVAAAIRAAVPEMVHAAAG